MRGPLAAQLKNVSNAAGDAVTAHSSVQEVVDDNLPQQAGFVAAMQAAYASLVQNGTRATVATYVSTGAKVGPIGPIVGLLAIWCGSVRFVKLSLVCNCRNLLVLKTERWHSFRQIGVRNPGRRSDVLCGSLRLCAS